MTPAELWQRYQQWLYYNAELGIYLDVSRVRFTDSFIAEIEAKFVKAFEDMQALERGAIANPDEHRMVGHYWLRAPELWRTNTLEEDLAFYYGKNWRSEVKASPACEEYVKRLKVVSDEQPELLVAHAYTRYLGDLSGGQILKNIAKNAMGLEDGGGLSFYEFEDIKNPGKFKNKYRAAMDGLPVSEQMAQTIVDEANLSFHMNMKMFQELEGNWFIGLMRLTFNALRAKLQSMFGASEKPASQAG